VTDPLGNTTTYTYDAAGNRTAVTDPAGHVTRYTYDAGHHLLTQSADVSINGVTATATMTYTYTPLNLLASVTDPDGRVTRYSYDGDRQLIGVTDNGGNTTTYTRDAQGDLTAQTDANGHTTTYTFDSLNHPTGVVYPDGARTRYTYDSANNLATATNARGQTTTYTYDALNQPVTVAYPDHTVTYANYPGGQTEAITDTPASTGIPSVSRYGIDAMGRVITATTPQGAITYTYDGAGNRASITTPGGTTTYSYDADNRLSAVTDPRGQTTTYTYDGAGNLAGKTLANGTTTIYSYDALNRLTGQQTTTAGGTTLYQEQDSLDLAGLRTGARQTDASGVVTTISYGYDAKGRLDAERQVRGTATVLDDSYSFDNVGNRMTKGSQGGASAYQYNARDELVSSSGPGAASYSYDADGNLTSRTAGGVTTLYTYDSQNRLLTVGVQGSSTLQASYLYDTQGNRVSVMDGQGHITAVLFDTQAGLAQVVRETPSNGAPTDYVYGLDRVSLTRNGATSDYLYDGHGNTAALIDASVAATVQDTYRYDAYGNLLARTGAVANSFLYDGQQFDASTGLYNLRARYMDPTTGRFLQTDPLHGSLQDPPALHRYLYARDNPVTYADPSGQESIVEEETVFSIVTTLAKTSTLLNFFKSNGVAIASTAASIYSAQVQVKDAAAIDNLDVAEATTDLYGTTGSNYLSLTVCKGAPGSSTPGVSQVNNALGLICNLLGIISVQNNIASVNPNSAVLSAGLLPQLVSFQVGGPVVSTALNILAFVQIEGDSYVAQKYVQTLPFAGSYVNEDWQAYLAQIANLYIFSQLAGLLGNTVGGGLGGVIGDVVSKISAAVALELSTESVAFLIIDTLPDAEAGAPVPPNHRCHPPSKCGS